MCELFWGEDQGGWFLSILALVRILLFKKNNLKKCSTILELVFSHEDVVFGFLNSSLQTSKWSQWGEPKNLHLVMMLQRRFSKLVGIFQELPYANFSTEMLKSKAKHLHFWSLGVSLKALMLFLAPASCQKLCSFYFGFCVDESH